MRDRSKTDRRHRGRYRVVDNTTGETLGAFFNDEGYKEMYLETLVKLLPEYCKDGVRIVGVEWPDFQEVTVLVEKVE